MNTLDIFVLLLSAVVNHAEVVPIRPLNLTGRQAHLAEAIGKFYYKAFPTEELLQLSDIDEPSNVTSTPAVIGRLEEENGGVVVTGDCAFQITGDLQDPAPLFVVHGKYEWLIPNTEGVMQFKNGQYFDMYCTDSFSKPFLNKSVLSAQCLQGQYYLVNGTIFPLSNFSCMQWSTYTARHTDRQCNGGTDLLEIGFEVKGGFLHTMDICHDEINEATRYVHHVLNPSSFAFQHHVPRPFFIENGFYAGKNVNKLFKEQNITMSRILNMDASSYVNYSRNAFLTRGHLAAKTDFILGSLQRATFLFVNAAPQWYSFNSGNWERVEVGVRKYAFNNSLTLDCYTGTWGISTLPDVNGNQKELYLYFDENNNGLIPVPKIFFRIVIDRATRRGIVLIGVNNPHASVQKIREEYIVCEDIGGEIEWIEWDKENLYLGYSYACSVPDFLRTVKDLPIEDLKTTGVLGVSEVGCSFRVSGDLEDQAPLFAKSGIYDWLHPEPNGFIELRYGESIDMYCSDSFVQPFENITKITVQCLKEYKYLVNGELHNFSTFGCSASPTYTARRTGRSCNGGTDLLEIGFPVEKGFLKTMDICHDEINEVTRYVHHVLSPSSLAFQHHVPRPFFIENGFYAGKNVNKLFKEQNTTVSRILKMDASSYLNYSRNAYLSRGHLAAKADFILASLQRATFLFVNAAPQWYSFNSGNWVRVEAGLREYAFNNSLTLDIYTGTWGISTLPDVNGNQKELYLYFDENNNGLIPVPKIFFKVVIDQATLRGIVLIGVNNPYASVQQIREEYIVCEDIGGEVNWIDWDKENIYLGYSYACSVPDFLRSIKDLPVEDLRTTGVLSVTEIGRSFRVNGDQAPRFAKTG